MMKEPVEIKNVVRYISRGTEEAGQVIYCIQPNFLQSSSVLDGWAATGATILPSPSKDCEPLAWFEQGTVANNHSYPPAPGYERGWEAAKGGQDRQSNPFAGDTTDGVDWLNGFDGYHMWVQHRRK